MAVKWDAGLIYWKDHISSGSGRYSLAHLHPFIQAIQLQAKGNLPARSLQLHVSFNLHTFTRACAPHDVDLYRDNRETRTFCALRYARSVDLPGIVQTLQQRRCEFARDKSGMVNYVTIETTVGERYAAFFDLRRLQKVGPEALHLTVKSAYVLDANKPTPGKGRISFHALVGHALRGTHPHPPP
jgi:hypothetical protein